MNLDTSRMQAVQSPVIPIVGELIRSYPGTISLGQGVVYYPPPPEAFEQLQQFLADPENHKYKSVEGISPLLDTIAAKLQIENNIALNSESCIVVTAGSNMAFTNAVLAITSPGDEIILQTPYYFNHEMAIRMAGCRPVLVPTEENYQLRLDAIREAITDKTRAVVTISPNNPTGVVYPQAALQAVNQLCRDRNLYHISDEAYEYFTYKGVQHFSPASLDPSCDRTISLYSLSKAYGFASWRIGYMLIPKHLLPAIKKIQDTILICPPVISQYAALGALKAGSSYCRDKLRATAEIREIVLEELSHLQDCCTIAPADGAFYFFIKVHTVKSAMEVVEQLIRDYGIAVIPGDAFGMEDGCYLRLAYGSMLHETAKEGMQRLIRGLQFIAKP